MLHSWCYNYKLHYNCLHYGGVFTNEREKPGIFRRNIFPAEILQAVEKYKFHQSKGKLKLELE